MTTNMKPGDIVVYRERGLTLNQDRKLRATFHSAGPCRLRGLRREDIFVTKDGQGLIIDANDVMDVESTQHGWLGLPQASGAW